ncbi:hypothetical protein BECAL_01136 [Bellilinea caldifistulae]|uniref:hypothetical protein n=1 Tax=Bellilinea caldifistulae TaxID=360411 RepID=UPI000E092528|nr:hypothetical protein [Bellilinea caldifistulae]GAP09982.1 hypothetical protein BECAL_01136 [Bellilinea caldifistulae]
MSEIVIPKRYIILSLVLIGLVAAAIWFAPQLYGGSLAQAGESVTTVSPSVDPSEAEDAAARDAALAGTKAFYTVDYTTGQQHWLDQLCSVSTQTGCIVYQNVIVPNLWSQLEEGKTVTTVEVSAQQKVQEQVASTRDHAPMQVWRLNIQLSSPWPMQKEPITDFPALVLVIKENGSWKFERFLTDEELQAFSTDGGQP